MVTPNYSQNQGKPPGQPHESILFVHPEKEEQLWDIYVWRFPEYNGTAEPSLVTLTSKRHSDKALDMKLLATFLPSRHQEVQDIMGIPYCDYVRRKALFILEMGVDNLEKKYVEGEEQ